MTVSSFIKIDKLLKYIDVEIQEALKSRAVYSWSNYAWENEHTIGELVGLAKWETESPMKSIITHDKLFSEKEKKRLLSLEIVGDDLHGLIEMSRISIGHAIVYSELAKSSLFSFNNDFWVAYLSAMTMLSMASERLRELFSLAYYKHSPRVNNDKIGDNYYGKYTGPFCKAKKYPLCSQLEDRLTILCDLVNNIFNFGIKIRNALVHELASKHGKLAKSSDMTHSERQSNCNTIIYSEVKKKFDDAAEEHEKEIESAIKILVDFYKNIINAASVVYDIEHAIRFCSVQ